MLKLRNIKHNVLNAKLHQKEADIVAEAGLQEQLPLLPTWLVVVRILN
jgi:preprotein translocase subunit SecA